MIRVLPFAARAALAAMAITALSGCVRTVAGVVTAPVRVVSQGADWATTSQSEADRNRGRELRRREERLGELQRGYRRHNAQCAKGDRSACAKAQREYEEMQRIMPTVPVERR